MRRYELFCRKLILERHYDAAAFLTSSAAAGIKGDYAEPGADLGFRSLAASLMAKMASYAATRKHT